MDKNIFTEIISELNQSIPEKSNTIELSEDYDAIPLNKENFHKIDLIKSNKKIAFVDGGNAEIIGAPNFSLHFIRVYYSIYQNNKRVKNKKIEFYALATAFNEQNKIKFKTKLFGEKILDEEKLIFDSKDRTLKTGKHRFSILKIGEIVRRFAELKTATDLINELNQGDFIVLDGDLEESLTNEDFYLKHLFKKADEKNILISALSKTSRLFTDTGDSFNTALNQIAPDFPWYYYPVLNFKNNALKVCFIKLNQKSKYIFKFEFLDKLNQELFSLLMENSIDPIFLGYPYGLIEADRFARISNKEQQYLQTLLMARAGKDWKDIAQYIKSIDAHDVLDSIG